MNVTEQKAYAGPVESHRALGSRFIEAEVETAPVVERKNIVEERIFVRELHHGSNRHHQNVRLEGLIPLHQPWRILRKSRCCSAETRTIQGRQPDSAIGGIRKLASRRLGNLCRCWLR